MARAAGSACADARAPGKVNLGLFVGAPRADGLHPIVSIVQPVTLADELTLEPAGDRDTVVCPGVRARTSRCARSPSSAPRRAGTAPPQRLTIDKRLPIAAGMAGGSSDAAAALRLAAEASGLPIPPDLPMRLGADVPVMLAGTARWSPAPASTSSRSRPARPRS